jgi:hypothetical protein
MVHVPKGGDILRKWFEGEKKHVSRKRKKQEKLIALN